MYGCKKLGSIDPNDKCLIIKIRQDIVNERGSIYEAVRWSWKIKMTRADEVEYVLAVINGVVRGIFKNLKWQKCHRNRQGRIEFEGVIVKDGEIYDKYIDKLIPEKYRKKGQANPVITPY